MMINAIPTVAALAAALNRPETPAAKPAASPSSADQVSISGAARSLQQNDAWQAALAGRNDGIPKLIPVDAAIAGGMDALQKDLGQWLQAQGFDKSANFSVNYDAASQTFTVKGPADIKKALEKELNGNSANALGATFRQSYPLLQDLSGSSAAVRRQYGMDRAGGGYDALSRQQGFSYRFSLDMAAGRLQPNLKLS